LFSGEIKTTYNHEVRHGSISSAAVPRILLLPNKPILFSFLVFSSQQMPNYMLFYYIHIAFEK